MQLQTIQTKIHEIRGYRVMLDFDLAELYETETKSLSQLYCNDHICNKNKCNKTINKL